MSLKHFPALLAALLLLTACQAPEAASPTATPTPEPVEVRIDWLHGFYATNSYSQLSYTADMDAVSVGWARLEYIDGILAINDTYANGNYSWVKPSGAEEVTDFLSEHHIPCNLNVYATSGTFAALTEDGLRADAVAALVHAAAPYTGLTIDFEGLRTAARSNFSDFMTALRLLLPPDKSLYVCVQPDTWFGGYDYRALGQVCDKVILMAHDYQWVSVPEGYVGGTDTYSPLTPLDQVALALDHITDPDTGVQDRSKLAIQIAFNSCGFHVDEEGVLLEATLYHPATDTIARRLGQPDSIRVWDEQSSNPSLWYTTEDGEHYHLWYEDAESVWAKLELAAQYGITGVSIWRLGLIPDYPELEQYDVWSMLTSPVIEPPSAATSAEPAGHITM